MPKTLLKTYSYPLVVPSPENPEEDHGVILCLWYLQTGHRYQQEITSDYGKTWTPGYTFDELNVNQIPTSRLYVSSIVEPVLLQQWHRMWDLGLISELDAKK